MFPRSRGDRRCRGRCCAQLAGRWAAGEAQRLPPVLLPCSAGSSPRCRGATCPRCSPVGSALGSRAAESNMAGAATTPGLTPLLPRMGRDFSLPPPNVARQNARRPRLLCAPFPGWARWGWWRWESCRPCAVPCPLFILH